MHASDSVKDGEGRQEMVATWQLAFWSWSLFWKISAISSDGPPQPILIFSSFALEWFNLSWFIWRWWWQWWRGNHPESDSKNAYSKKCYCLSFLYVISTDPVFLNCMHILSSCIYHPPCYINSYGKDCFISVDVSCFIYETEHLP